MQKVTEQAKNAVRGALNGIMDDTVVIKRSYHDDITSGVMLCYKKELKLTQFSAELPWLNNHQNISCIPEGVYDVIAHVSPKFGKCFWVKDVDGRGGILFHTLNYVFDEMPGDGNDEVESRGCIGPAKEIKDINGDGHDDGSSSKRALNDMIALYPNGFTLIITS